MAEAIWPQIQAFDYQLHLAGIPLMVGTDLVFPGVVPGYSLHEEMMLWQEAGVPAAQILRGATSTPARFGVGDSLGPVKPGGLASLVLVRGNPLDNIRNAGQIEWVLLRGCPYTLSELIACYRSSMAGAG